ncbi:MAG TPA: AbrB/MazE/SpoVT family DNA-binding domain-containing protein [Acidimicrobiales bacterium]|nr:AbrB/MazE/SpoVT family DNA-binding domain-containing protein [Acidimicrobiales bacterium]
MGDGDEAVSGQAQVSSRGQMALPARTRRRWGLDQGGTVAWLDLGDAVVLVPGGIDDLRRRLLAGADWEGARVGFGDPELANQ